MTDKTLSKVVMSHEYPTPEEIVTRLDKYVIGQTEAKKAVAIALRNRWRRQRVTGKIREEIYPNNIILIGPTGVGKTEIARRLAGIAHAPFIKVEASRFTEVGYVGRDVESMIRGLVEISVNMVRQEKMKLVGEKAKKFAEEKILDILLPVSPIRRTVGDVQPLPEKPGRMTREKMRKLLQEGKFDERTIEIEVTSRKMPFVELFNQAGIGDISIAIEEAFGNKFSKKKKKTEDVSQRSPT